jgi:hypothetical protein
MRAGMPRNLEPQLRSLAVAWRILINGVVQSACGHCKISIAGS